MKSRERGKRRPNNVFLFPGRRKGRNNTRRGKRGRGNFVAQRRRPPSPKKARPLDWQKRERGEEGRKGNSSVVVVDRGCFGLLSALCWRRREEDSCCSGGEGEVEICPKSEHGRRPPSGRPSMVSATLVKAASLSLFLSIPVSSSLFPLSAISPCTLSLVFRVQNSTDLKIVFISYLTTFEGRLQRSLCN